MENIVIILSLLIILYPVQPLKRDLADVRYRFTTCNATGRIGPTYQSCMEYYTMSNSRLTAEPFLYPEPGLKNAQTFNVSRVGLYNITAAGAAGGRGVCNTERGYGTARTVQVELYPSLELLVLVGQQGLGFCDFQPEGWPCVNKPAVPGCEERWFNYTREMYGNDSESVLDLLGGGGGGGASMVRAYSARGFDSDPVVIGAAGGGSAALLQYDIINDLDREGYQQFINGKPEGSGSNDGSLGKRNSSGPNTAGAGGGYRPNDAMKRLDIDGGFLTGREEEFALGGLHCDGLANVSVGGFGGGGGGCGGGGGGGGYTGGSVLSEGRYIPGEGGVSYTGSSFRTSFKVINFIADTLNTNLDGYVDIVHADCECVFRCKVYNEEDMFECTCPTGTSVAPDNSDCYDETTLLISEGPISQLAPDENGIIFNYQLFTLDSRIFLYSVDFRVVLDSTVDESEEETVYDRCIVGFLGEDYQLVAQTDVHRQSVQRLNTISPVTSEGSQGQVPFLDTPVVVYAGLVVSAGNCSVENLTLNVNISIRDRQVDETKDIDSAIPLEVAEEFLEGVTTRLTSQPPTNISSNDRTTIYVAAVSTLVVLIIIVVLLVVCCICIGQKKCKRKIENVNLLTEPLVTTKSLSEQSEDSTQLGRGEDYVMYKYIRSE